MMNDGVDAVAAVPAWLERLTSPGAPPLAQAELPAASAAAIAALAAEALARGRSLLVVVPDDEALPDISNALDLGLRPLCLVLPAAEYATRIALRATLSLLKSRLARHGDDTEGPAWTAQRARVDAGESLWREALAWSARGLDREAWPAAIGSLFPVHILPAPVAPRLAATADWVVLVEPSRLPKELHAAWPGAARTLLLEGAAVPAGHGALAAVDTTARLRAELELLTQELADLELELATAQAELAEFTRRYTREVGVHLAELDRLQAEIAAHRARRSPEDAAAHRNAEEAQARAAQSERESRRFADLGREEPPAFAPSRDLKKLYRQLAQKIHPDRARDESDRHWRTQLMSEANRAYRSGDEAGLREVLALWQEGEGRMPSGGRPAAPAGLMAQVASVRSRVAAIEAELNRLHGSRLYELYVAANLARRQGRDLLREMAERLDAQIAAARAELDREEKPVS